MDCLFNLQIPKSTEFEYIVRPNGNSLHNLNHILGKTFITGLASSYSMKYDPTLLKGLLSKDEFVYMISCFNDILFQFWPCPTCFAIGYMFSPCSLGLSFLFPNSCIADAEKSLKSSIDYFNKQKLKNKGIKARLVKKCSTSWVNIYTQ